MRLLVVAIVLAACGPPRATPAPPRERVQLFHDAPYVPPADATGAAITPTAYELDLAVDPSSTGYSGIISIDLAVGARASAIWLDADELEIDRATLTGGGTVQRLELVPDAPDGRLGLTIPDPIDAGTARLEIKFSADYRTDDGIFAQSYRAVTYVYSDFEPLDAHRGFPCFDEPRFKTPWKVSLVVPEGLVALSNTAEVRRADLADGLTRVEFAATPPLPTYLVAIAVGDFDVVDAGSGVRIVAPQGRGDWAARAAEYAPAILEASRALIDRDVPFDKIDIVSVPRFGGAMENPGLITVADDILLDDRTEDNRRKLALVLAHELAHLWFGDSVTLTDWRDLWINEGLATWMADEVLAAWRPEWNTRLGEIGARHDAMAEDDAPGAHALRPDSLAGPRALFDVLTYQKASSVLHMIEAWAGEDAFRGALRGYLDAHAGAGATSADVLAALGTLDEDVERVLAPLLDRPGVPVLDATVSCGESGARVALAVRDAGGGPLPACVRWRDDAGTHRACTIVDGSADLALGASCPTWVHPNAGGDGYYRWWLDGADLAAVIGDPKATDRERLDAARAVRGALSDGTAAHDVAAALAAGARSGIPEVVKIALADYRVLIDQAAPDGAVKAISAHLRKAIAPAVKKLGTAPRSTDSDADRALRSMLLTAAGLAGESKVIAWATKAARRWLDHDTPPPEELEETVLTVAAAHADARLVRSMTKAASGVMDDLGDTAPMFGRALGRLPATQGLAVLTEALDGGLPSMITMTIAIEQLTRRDVVAETADQLAARGDWFAIALMFAPVCDPDLVDRAGRAASAELTRRRADAARCDALRPRLTGAAKAFK